MLSSSRLRTFVFAAACFALAAAALGYAFDKPSIANAIPDPVTPFRAQDETLYSNIALRMAQDGGWLTPRFLGRFLMYKPPLLTWFAGASLKLMGVSLAALRAPALIAGAIGLVAIWLWPGRRALAAIAALLLAENSLWHTFSRICQSDILHGACLVIAMLCLASDPSLARPRHALVFGVFSGLDIMAKSAAGLIPLIILVLYAALVPKETRPPIRRIALAIAAAVLIAAPWHIYQLIVHTNWFWADYVQVQLFSFGLHPPFQVSAEPRVIFYLHRLWSTDPFLCVLFLIAAPSFIRSALRRNRESVLLAVWLFTAFAACLAFQYKSLHYLISIVPAMCIAAPRHIPLTKSRSPAIAMMALVVIFVVKATTTASWRLNYQPEPPMAVVPVLKNYYALGRSNGLTIILPDDDFYASTLPGLAVHYCFLDSAGLRNFPPHLVYLNVAIPATEVPRLDRDRDEYQRRLRGWGLDSAEPIATVIVAGTPAEIVDMIRVQPSQDFLLPEQFAHTISIPETHTIDHPDPDKVLLLSRHPQLTHRPPLPVYW